MWITRWSSTPELSGKTEAAVQPAGSARRQTQIRKGLGMASIRHDRIQEQIKEIASSIILYELKDPRVGFVTVTRVDLSPDLRYATIYYSVLGSDVDTRLTARAIGHARGHIQREIAKRVRIRFAPIIKLEIDESPKKSLELAHLIDEAVAEDEQRRQEHEEEHGGEEAEDETADPETS